MKKCLIGVALVAAAVAVWLLWPAPWLRDAARARALAREQGKPCVIALYSDVGIG